MGILTDGSPTWPSRIEVERSVNNPSLYKKGPITEIKVKVAGTTMDQRRSYGKEYVKRAIQTHDDTSPIQTYQYTDWDMERADSIRIRQTNTGSEKNEQVHSGIVKLGEVCDGQRLDSSLA